MKRTQINQIAENKTNQSSTTLFSILLHRLELTGLFKSFVVRTSLGRCSSMVRSIAIIAILFTFFTLFLPSNTYATAPTLTLNITNSTVSLDIMPISENGTFASSSSDISFTVNTNNYTGYTLGITASSNDANAANLTQDVTEGGNTTTYAISSIGTVSGVTSSGITESTFSTSSNTQYNNTWGMKPSKLNSSNNSNYLPAPTSTSNTITIDTTTAANTNNVANSYTIGIGARIDNDLPPGAYTNTFVVTAVARALTYSITYNANDGNNGNDTTDMPQINPVTSVVNPNTSPNYTITLASAPSRDGYNFLGWCTTQVADGAACTGTEYQAGGSYEINYTSSNVFTLYARWEDDNPCRGHETELYCKVLDEWVAGGSRVQTNDTNTSTGIKAAITTANSGVFKYNSEVFGEDSDATKADGTKDDIYYFRGILDQTTGSYGSDGDGVAWPNYVVLSEASSSSGLTTNDTCWRIVRTTGSGGVKMVYNGKWTGSTCANATTNAQVITSTFNDSSASNGYTSLAYRNIHAVGYTYNSAVNGVTSASANTTIAKVFGTSTNNGYTVNSSDSIIKQYIEKTWFTNISAYQNILETSAGYCNDRTVYPDGSYALSNKLAEDTQIVPYGTSGMTVYYFGAYTRNMNAAQAPTLNCPRGTVDLYSVSGASTGNGQLTKPASLLTADELSFAGSGSSTASEGSSYNANSYLRSGSGFWLLSPSYRSLNGAANECYPYSNGNLNHRYVGSTFGVRPAISLASGTTAASGSGTATDPWVVTAP